MKQTHRQSSCREHPKVRRRKNWKKTEKNWEKLKKNWKNLETLNLLMHQRLLHAQFAMLNLFAQPYYS
jgi:hypothetical protein